MNHSRWLTTANRLLRLWVSKHRLNRKNSNNLRFIVEFIIAVYYPHLFKVKVKHSGIERPWAHSVSAGGGAGPCHADCENLLGTAIVKP